MSLSAVSSPASLWPQDALMVLVTLLAACGWVFSRETLQGMEPALFLSYRFTIAGVLLGLLSLSGLRELGRTGWRRAALTGLVMGVALNFWITGLHQATHMGVGAFLTSLGVVLVPITGKLLFRTAISRATWLAMSFAIFGLAFLSLEQNLALSTSDLWFLAAATAFSFHFHCNSHFAATLPALPLTAVQLTMTGLMALAVTGFTEGPPQLPPSEVLGWLGGSILLGTCARFFLQVRTQGKLPATRAALWMTLEPVWVTLVGVVGFGERLSLWQGVGCLLILVALLVSRLGASWWQGARSLSRLPIFHRSNQ